MALLRQEEPSREPAEPRLSLISRATYRTFPRNAEVCTRLALAKRVLVGSLIEIEAVNGVRPGHLVSKVPFWNAAVHLSASDSNR